MLLDGSWPPGPPPEEPMALFLDTWRRAATSEPLDATAVALATSSSSGMPSVRMVLVKEADERGFVFYTSDLSRKAHELRVRPRAALCFHWPSLSAQIRVEGEVEKVAGEEADAYFATRPRESQLAAWASRQSETLSSWEELCTRFEAVQAQFQDRVVSRPPHWGGYRVVPARIEFWWSGAHRLHHRVAYMRSAAGWTRSLLFP